MSSVAHRTLPYLWTLSHKRKNFGIEFLNYLFVWFFLQILSETFLILRRIQRDTITNVETSSCKVLAALLTVQSDLNFVDRFSKNPQISNIMKILIMGAELFHAGRQMDGWMDGWTNRPDEANSRFLPFLNAPKKGCNKNRGRNEAPGCGSSVHCQTLIVVTKC